MITFSFRAARRIGAPGRPEPERGIEGFVDELREVLDDRAIARAIICGVSFGGLVALRFAANHPERTSALVLVSTPAPGWHLRPRHEVYARLPWLLGPLFLLETPWRIAAELAAALPDPRARRRFIWGQLRAFATAPLSLPGMAARARLIGGADVATDCAQVRVPTLIVTGEPTLDRVVPVAGTTEYVRLISGARAARIERTGHLGYITRPEAFASLVGEFVGATVAADTCAEADRASLAQSAGSGLTWTEVRPAADSTGVVNEKPDAA